MFFVTEVAAVVLNKPKKLFRSQIFSKTKKRKRDAIIFFICSRAADNDFGNGAENTQNDILRLTRAGNCLSPICFYENTFT